MRVQVRVLGPDDEGVLMNVAPDVFDGPIDPVRTMEFLRDPRRHILVAIDDDVVVGFASAVHSVHLDKAPQLWINDLAVAPPHQRRGLAQEMRGAGLNACPNLSEFQSNEAQLRRTTADEIRTTVYEKRPFPGRFIVLIGRGERI